MKQADFYKQVKGGLQCQLCPHFCILKSGETGICLSRKNIDGELFAINYDQVCSVSIDPMEKKPLYHFFPGSMIFSLGNNGCNLKCKFCQNWEISQQVIPTKTYSSHSILETVQSHKLRAVAFTYAEPLIWYEFIMETAILLKKNGIKTVLVTNGMINQPPLLKLLPWIDAMNVDIKSMQDSFYRNICEGFLKPVLKTAETAAKSCHLEMTNLIIPGLNDSDKEFEELGLFIANNLGRHTPLHLSRYFPCYQLDIPPTPVDTMQRAKQITSQYLDHVFLGNLGHEDSSTYCPKCRSILIKREGYRVLNLNLTEMGNCLSCDYPSHIMN